MSQSGFQMTDLLQMAKRRWPWIVLPAITLISVFIVMLMQIPNIYLASSQILLEPKAVPDDMVRNILPEEATSRLETIKQSILSRENLEGIVKKFQLYSDVGDNSPSWMERKVQWFRNEIQFEIINLNRTGQSIHFKIEYANQDPVVARDVTQNLANLFIEFDYKMRLDAIENTTSFFENELKKIESRMSVVQQRLAAFKSRYSDELPEQLDINQRTLDRLQDELKANGEAIDRMEARKLELERLLAGTPKTVTDAVKAGATSTLPPDVQAYNTKKQDLQNLHEQLRQLLTRYTEAHPDVIEMRKRIKTAEAQLKNMEAQLLAKGETGGGKDPEKQINPVWSEVNSQINSVETELKIRKKERVWFQQQTDLYTRRVANTPLREQEIEATRREYNSLLEDYERMKRNLSQAKLSKNLEDKQRGEQFKIIEAAVLPRAPFKPNRQRAGLVVLLLGLGVGAGLAFFRETTDHTIHEKSILQKHFKKPVLVSIPHFAPEHRKRRELLQRIAKWSLLFIVFITVTIIGCYAVHYLSLAGMISGIIYQL